MGSAWRPHLKILDRYMGENGTLGLLGGYRRSNGKGYKVGARPPGHVFSASRDYTTVIRDLFEYGCVSTALYSLECSALAYMARFATLFNQIALVIFYFAVLAVLANEPVVH